MKRYVFLLPVLLALFASGMLYITFFSPNKAIITKKPIVIHETYISPANIKQIRSSVVMGAWNGKLYIVPSKGDGIVGTKYQDRLCVFENGELSTCFNLRKTGLSAKYICGDTAFFTSDQSPSSLYSYSLAEETLKELYSLKSLPDPQSRIFTHNMFFREDDSLFFSVIHFSEPERLHVRVAEDNVISCEDAAETYVLGDMTYYIREEYNEDFVYRKDAEGHAEKLPLEPALERCIIRTDHGILIHNMRSAGRGVMLYYLTEAGDLIELFDAPQLSSVSAVTVYHDMLYFSFMRSEKYGNIGMLGFENDDLIGTWRISLTDYSIEKLSDEIYDGLYIFDDTGIYACDCYCDLYKLDFDGKVIETLMEVIH